MEWYRCPDCKNPQFKAHLDIGSIVEIKCRWCKSVHTYGTPAPDITPSGPELVRSASGGWQTKE